jgi:AI-2 transport protein TqsA
MKSALREEQTWLVVGSLMIIAVVALAAGLIYTRVVLVPFVLAVFLTTVVAPVVDYQVVRCKIPPSVAIMLALVLVVLILSLLGFFLIVSGYSIVATAGEYSEAFEKFLTVEFEWLKAQKIEWLDVQKITNTFEDVKKELRQQLPTIISQVAGTGTVLIANGIMITFFVIFLLAGRDPRHASVGVRKDIETAVRRYIVTKFAISAVTGLLVWWILHILGLQMAFVFGLLTFLLNFIPSVGSVIATFLPLPLALVQFAGDWPIIISTVAIPGTLQMVIGNVIEPKLMGRGLELHPVSILLSLAFWGLLWGYMGMVLAVPITAIIRIILIRYETTRPIGELLGGKLPGNEHSISAPLVKMD